MEILFGDNLDRYTAYESAMMFDASFRVLLGRVRPLYLSEPLGSDSFSLAMPTIVNGLMAIELFLKFVLIDAEKTHDLIRLVDALEVKRPQIYRSTVMCTVEFMRAKGHNGYSIKDFDSDLRKYSGAFTEFRYFYDMGSRLKNTLYSIEFVEGLELVLESFCTSLREKT